MNAAVKVQAMQYIAGLPDDVTWQQLADQFAFTARLARADQDIDDGNGIPHEQVTAELETWLASFGPPMPVASSPGS